MQAFRDGKVKCLIATNVCARGLDIPEIGIFLNRFDHLTGPS